MRSRRFTIIRHEGFVCCVFLMLLTAATAAGQRVAIITPNDHELDKAAAAELVNGLKAKKRLQDVDMTAAAYSAVKPAEPSNMSVDEAKRVGSAIGSDLFVLVVGGTRRRAQIDRPDKFESFAVIYVVSSRSGLLKAWKLINAEGAEAGVSQAELIKALAQKTDDIDEVIDEAFKQNSFREPPKNFEEIPESESAAARGFRPPVPYRRLKPEYTRMAYLYDVTATVDAMVELDPKGQIQHIEITRWAGYGLDESVAAAIRSMNWRPAERGGKPLPIRFLLRYNFKKTEKDDTNE